MAPLLFNIYIYDLPSTTSRKYAYAVDLALLHSSRDWKGLEETLSQDMATLSAYLKTCRLKLSHAKTMMAAFHLHNQVAKREVEVYTNGKLLPFHPVPTYLGVKLDRSLTFRHHLETLPKKLATCIMLLRQLARSRWSTGTKTLCTAALSLVYITPEYCIQVWCHRTHTRLVDNVLNDTLHIVTASYANKPHANSFRHPAS